MRISTHATFDTCHRYLIYVYLYFEFYPRYLFQLLKVDADPNVLKDRVKPATLALRRAPTEHHDVRALFKDLDFNIRKKIAEIYMFDYKAFGYEIPDFLLHA